MNHKPKQFYDIGRIKKKEMHKLLHKIINTVKKELYVTVTIKRNAKKMSTRRTGLRLI